MKVNFPANPGFRRVLLAIIILVSCTFSSAYCQSQKITLLVQQTPNNGGQVAPATGAYKFDQNSEITLTATPNEGYEFLHWLGDVSNQESVSTTVRIDKPKIIIAVFKPVHTDIDASKDYITSGGGGGGGSLVDNRVAIGNSVSLSGGPGGGNVKPQGQSIYVPAGDKPPVVPEPATGLLLALGSYFTFRKRRRGKLSLSQN